MTEGEAYELGKRLGLFDAMSQAFDAKFFPPALDDWNSPEDAVYDDVECGNRKSASVVCTLQASHDGDHCDFENPMAGQWH